MNNNCNLQAEPPYVCIQMKHTNHTHSVIFISMINELHMNIRSLYFSKPYHIKLLKIHLEGVLHEMYN